MSELRQQKRELRHAMESLRAEAIEQNPNAALAVCDVFLKTVHPPPRGIVSIYNARGSEMDPAPVADALRMRGHPIALPTVVDKTSSLVFRLYNPGDKLIPGVMGILEPDIAARAVEPDILLVPLLAFDRLGNRLGYGGGYYDRTLTALRARKPILAIGIAFAVQEVPEVPVGPSDARLDRIITEIKVFHP